MSNCINYALLRAKVVEAGKTQSSLALKKGCTLNTINKFLNGHVKRPTIDDALFFCKELNITDDKEKCAIFLFDSSL
ncbi:MAG: helix-turn-helix transcriptional regulator [Coprobacillus sp.]